jgi:hypothetical protein
VRARLGVALLVTGVRLRAALESLTRRDERMWTHAWQHRRNWLPGYPAARGLIFGGAA